jgi:Mn-dependent DtxR family transcriptional regulator
LRTNYEYSPEGIRQIVRNLKERGLVDEDKFGFFVPTPKGERLIEALTEEQEPALSEVPPLPEI